MTADNPRSMQCSGENSSDQGMARELHQIVYLASQFVRRYDSAGSDLKGWAVFDIVFASRRARLEARRCGESLTLVCDPIRVNDQNNPNIMRNDASVLLFRCQTMRAKLRARFEPSWPPHPSSSSGQRNPG